MDPYGWYVQRRMLNAMVQNNWKEAERYNQNLIRHSGSSMGLQYNLALVSLGLGKKQEAYSLLTQAVETFGESLRLCRLLGDIQYLDGQADQAKRWYSSALEDNPNEKESKLLALRLEILNDPNRYARVMENQKDLPLALQAMETDPQRSLSLYLHIVEDDPTQVESLNNIGVLYLENFKNAPLAEQYFSRVLELVDHTGAAKNLAKVRKRKA